jgi:hypothetical protein
VPRFFFSHARNAAGDWKKAGSIVAGHILFGVRRPRPPFLKAALSRRTPK